MALSELLGRTFQELPERDENENRTGVAYVSVLFGITVGALAAAAVPPVQALIAHTTYPAAAASVWHSGVAFVLTVTSFVGYFASKNAPQLRIKFFNLPLVQIFLDSAMVITYFFVAVYAEKAEDAAASAAPEAILVAIAFGLYLLWDFVGWRIRSDTLSQLALGRARDTAWGYRRWVTVGGCAVMTLVAVVVRFSWWPHLSVLWWDAALIVLLIVYRMVKSFGDRDIRYRGQVRDNGDKDGDLVVPAAFKHNAPFLDELVRVKEYVVTDTNHLAVDALRAAGGVEVTTDEDFLAMVRPSRAAKAYVAWRSRSAPEGEGPHRE